MPVDSKHAEFIKQEEDWQKIRDCIEGESAIKSQAEEYLPAPPGIATKFSSSSDASVQVAAGTDRAKYIRYLNFAEFPEIVSPAINGLQGLVHAKPPEVNLPAAMEYLREAATADGDSIEELWELVTREVISMSRVCLLSELSEVNEDELHLCAYVAENLINWRQKSKIEGGETTLAVLEETVTTEKPDDQYEVENVIQWRELFIDPESGFYAVRVWRKDSDRNDGKPSVVTVEGENGEGEEFVIPSLRGKSFETIPLTVINASDRGFGYTPSPTLPMVRRALSIYRKTADYFRAIYMKCDPQVVVTGASPSDVATATGGYIGGGSAWAFERPDAKAYYLDISGEGIPLQRDAIQDEYSRFASETGRLLQNEETGSAESGEAIRRRQSMQQVTLKSLVINAAEGLQQALRQLGRLMGIDDATLKELTVVPNLDFTEQAMTTKEMVDLITAKNQGLMISHGTINEILRRRGVPINAHEEEEELIEDEAPSLGLIKLSPEEKDPEEKDSEDEDDSEDEFEDG